MAWLWIILLVSISEVNSFDLNIACNKNQTCESGSSIEFSLENNASLVNCTQKQCDLTLDLTIDFFQCEQDSYGNSCSPSFCFVTDDINTCFSGKQCASQTSDKMTCGKCQQNECEGNLCMTFMGSESCYSGKQCYFESAIFETKECQNNKDSFGEECNCCLSSYEEGEQKKLYSCASELPYENLEGLFALQKYKNLIQQFKEHSKFSLNQENSAYWMWISIMILISIMLTM